MALQEKYAKLIEYAEASNVEDLSITEQNNVLYVSGSVTASVKDQMWKIYSEIDPEMRAGDLVLDMNVVVGSEEIYEVQAGDSLSKIAAKYPGMTWNNIYEANKDQIKNPDVIQPGQKLIIPL